jgi:1,4-dihydroxy-2-naphthoate octaprenyltransferase
MGVLNMNNMRDYEADKNAGKRTIVVSIGPKKAAIYHLLLVAGAALLAILYTAINFHSLWQWLFLLSFPILFLNLRKVFSYKSALELYPELGRLSLASLFFSITFGLGLILK